MPSEGTSMHILCYRIVYFRGKGELFRTYTDIERDKYHSIESRDRILVERRLELLHYTVLHIWIF